MNNETKSCGIVIKAIDYQENAQIIYLFTKSGKENLIVRGAKKINSKTRSLTQTLTLITYEKTKNRELNTLTIGEVNDAYATIKADPQKMQVAFCILEKIQLFGEDTKNDEILFNFILSTLEHLKTSSYPMTLLAIFEVKFLYLLGLSPRFQHCPSCNEPVSDGYFSVDAGGVLCDRCRVQYQTHLSVQETKILKYLYLIKPEKIDEQFLKISSIAIDNIMLVIDLYYEHYLDFKSKSKAILKKIAG